MTLAVVFIPAAVHLATYAAQCLDYCANRGYEVCGIVTEDWPSVVKLVGAQAATVVVVARAEHLDPEREPRIEIAANAAASRYETRTRLIRRNAAE